MFFNNIKRLLAGAMLCIALAAESQGLFVGCYNIRYKNDGDAQKGFLWDKRCQVICDQLNFESPDVFGAQEVLAEQLHDLLRRLPRYRYIGVGRDDGREAGEYAAIFYRYDQVERLEEGHFWLSQTPDVPSLGWDAACIRICTWGKFRQKDTGWTFYFFNLHTDHVGVTARREAAKLVLKKIREMAGPGVPVILTGDFNVDQTDETYALFTRSGLLDDSYTLARQRFAENGTFNSFDPSLKTDSRIDHIFVSKGFQVPAYAVLPNFYWTEDKASSLQKGADAPQQINLSRHTLRPASDHYPVFVRLLWQGQRSVR